MESLFKLKQRILLAERPMSVQTKKRRGTVRFTQFYNKNPLMKDFV